MSPELYQGFTSAANAQRQLNQNRIDNVNSIMTTGLQQGPKINKDWMRVQLLPLARADPETAALFKKMVDDPSLPESGQELQNALVTRYGVLHPGEPMHFVPVRGDNGQITMQPAPQANLRANQPQGTPSAAPPAPNASAPGSGPPGVAPALAGQFPQHLPPAIGGFQPGLPEVSPQTEANWGNYAKQADDLAGPQALVAMRNQQALLSNMEKLAGNKVTGPWADAEVAINQSAQRLGLKATLEPGELANAESFRKYAERLVNEMAGRSDLNFAWQTAAGSNPSLDISRLGRAGIIHWLQGNADAQAAIQNAWNKFINTPGNQGQQYRFRDWLTLPAEQGGFDVANFDPRVFQFARLKGNEKREFLDAMTPSELKQFEVNDNRYRQRGLKPPVTVSAPTGSPPQ
jgi:hypothetical protein